MSKSNYVALIGGALVATVTFAIVEFLFEGAVGLFGYNEAAVFQESYPNLRLEGVAFQFANILQLLVLMIFAIWLYSSLIPRFGTGITCALIAAFAIWFVYLLVATNFARLGILPMNIALASLLFNLVEMPLAVLAGSRVYDAAKERPPVPAKP
jgi:hypothetical protein